MEVRIKEGALISHDFCICNWPDCNWPIKYHKNPYKIFDAEWTGTCWECRADGFGDYHDYGNGLIFVYGKDNVEEL